MNAPPCDRCGHSSLKHQGETLKDWSRCTEKLTERDDKGARKPCPCDGYFEPRGKVV